MTGRERVRNALQLKEVDRVPWVPFVGCHGGYLINVPAEEYLKSENHILAGIDEAVKRYAPDGLPVMFDLQVEAEVLGCNLVWAKENPPAVSTHPRLPLSEEPVKNILIWPSMGLLPDLSLWPCILQEPIYS